MVACGLPPLTCGAVGVPHRTPHPKREDSTFELPPRATIGVFVLLYQSVSFRFFGR